MEAFPKAKQLAENKYGNPVTPQNAERTFTKVLNRCGIKINYDFFYGSEADQFSFYRIPKLLFTDKRLSEISVEAKVLYGLLLDRLSLSRKNGWLDDENRVYVYFTLEEAMELIGIGKDKSVKIFAELDSEKGCGLITKKRQGQGKPTIIYVMNFNSDISSDYDSDEIETSENQHSEFTENTDNTNCRLLAIRSQDVGKTETNNTEYKNTEISNIYPISSYPDEYISDASDEMSLVDEMCLYRQIICTNIESEHLSLLYNTKTISGVYN